MKVNFTIFDWSVKSDEREREREHEREHERIILPRTRPVTRTHKKRDLLIHCYWGL